MTLLIVFGSIAAYLAIGWLVAVRSLPYAWEHARTLRYGSEYQRGNVAGWTAFRFLLWPFGLPALLMSHAITRTDPEWIQKQVAERDRRIRELERELNIR